MNLGLERIVPNLNVFIARCRIGKGQATREVGMRDASLVETIKCLSDRLQKLEAKCSVSQTSEELKDEQLKVHKFHILHDLPHRNEADHEEIALGLAKLANEDAQDQDDETFHTIKLLLSAFNPSHPTQAHFHHSKSSYEDQRQIQVGHMLC